MSVASLALLKSAACYLNKDVFQHLHEQVSLISKEEEGEGEDADKKEIKLPIPAVTLVSGGKSSPGMYFMHNLTFYNLCLMKRVFRS